MSWIDRLFKPSNWWFPLSGPKTGFIPLIIPGRFRTSKILGVHTLPFDGGGSWFDFFRSWGSPKRGGLKWIQGSQATASLNKETAE